MLKLYYTGPKPQISQHGVFFKKGKEDKYVYLELATKILLAIDKKYDMKKAYITEIDENKKLSDSQILDILKHYNPNLDTQVQDEEAEYEKHIQEMLDEVSSLDLTIDDKETWTQNILLMKPYLIQREINKLYYIHCIKEIKHIIVEHHVKEIDMSFDLKHWHILESIAGNLSYGIKSISTKIAVTQDNQGKLVAKLLINPEH